MVLTMTLVNASQSSNPLAFSVLGTTRHLRGLIGAKLIADVIKMHADSDRQRELAYEDAIPRRTRIRGNTRSNKFVDVRAQDKLVDPERHSGQ